MQSFVNLVSSFRFLAFYYGHVLIFKHKKGVLFSLTGCNQRCKFKCEIILYIFHHNRKMNQKSLRHIKLFSTFFSCWASVRLRSCDIHQLCNKIVMYYVLLCHNLENTEQVKQHGGSGWCLKGMWVWSETVVVWCGVPVCSFICFQIKSQIFRYP